MAVVKAMEDHEWNDGDVECVITTGDGRVLEICFVEDVEALLISITDVIALAEEFGLKVTE